MPSMATRGTPASDTPRSVEVPEDFDPRQFREAIRLRHMKRSSSPELPSALINALRSQVKGSRTVRLPPCACFYEEIQHFIEPLAGFFVIHLLYRCNGSPFSTRRIGIAG